jgi:hypothetical protein
LKPLAVGGHESRTSCRSRYSRILIICSGSPTLPFRIRLVLPAVDWRSVRCLRATCEPGMNLLRRIIRRSASSASSAEHQARSHSGTGDVQNFDQRKFMTYDAAADVSQGAWYVQLYCENVTDARADLYTQDNEWVKAITINRPRTIGLKISYNFSSKWSLLPRVRAAVRSPLGCKRSGPRRAAS